MKKYFFYLVSVFIMLISCNRETVNPKNLFEGKIKSLHLYDTISNGIDFTYKFNYDSASYQLKRIELYSSKTIPDTSSLVTYFDIINDNSIITLNKTELFNDRVFKVIKAHIQNNIITQLNYADTITNAETPYFYYVFNSKLDSVYEPGQFPAPINRRCYNYVLNANNYNQFSFEYDNPDFFGGLMHVQDTAYITYSNLPFNRYAPLQNMYSTSTLFNLYIPNEVATDNIYLLGFENYFFYPHNQNLIKSIHTVHNNSTVYFDYIFNTNNQLIKAGIHFPDASSNFLTYEMQYY